MNEVIQPSISSPHKQEYLVKVVFSHEVQTEKPKEILEKHVQQPQVNVSEKVINETVQEKHQVEEIKTKQAQQTVEEKSNAKFQQKSANKQEHHLIQEVQQLPAVRTDTQKKLEQAEVAAPRHMEGNIKSQQKKSHTSQQKADLNVDINPLNNLIIFKPWESQFQEQVVLPTQKQQEKTDTYQRVRQIQRPLDGYNSYEGLESRNAQDGLQKITRNTHHAELVVQTVEHKEDESISNHQSIVFEHPIQSNLQLLAAEQPSQADKPHQQKQEIVIPQRNSVKITGEPNTIVQQPPKHEETIDPKCQNLFQISSQVNIQKNFQHKLQQTPQESKAAEKPKEKVIKHQQKAQQSKNQKAYIIQHKQQYKIDIIHSQGTNQNLNVSANYNQQIVLVDKSDISHPQRKKNIQKHTKETDSNHEHVEQAPANSAVITHTQTQQPLLHSKQSVQLEFEQQQRQQVQQKKVKSQQKEVEQNHSESVAIQNVAPPVYNQAVDKDLLEQLEVKQAGKQDQHSLPKRQNSINVQINRQQSHREYEKIENHIGDAHEDLNEGAKYHNIQDIPNKIDAKTNKDIEKKEIRQLVKHQTQIESVLNQDHQPQATQSQEHPVQKLPSSPKQIEKQQAVTIKNQKDTEQKSPHVHLTSIDCITVEKIEIQQHPVRKIEQARKQVSQQHPVIQKQTQKSQIIQKPQHNQHSSQKNNHQPSLPRKDQTVKQEQNGEGNQPAKQIQQPDGRQQIQINIIKIKSDQELQNPNQVTSREQKIEPIPEKLSENGQIVVQDVKKPEEKHELTVEHHLNQINNQNIQQVLRINALQHTQDIQHISTIPQNHQEERASSGLSKAIADEKGNIVNAEPVQKVQPTQQQNIFEQHHIDNVQVEQKQAYKFNTQNIETIQEQKPNDRQVVEFFEFHQQQKIKSSPQPQSTHKQQPKQHTKLQSATIQQHQNITVSALNNHPVQIAATLKTIDVIHQQICYQKSPKLRQAIINKDGIGKIARKNVGEKRVNDVIEEMKKYDKQPKKQPRPTSRRRKIDASKVEHISLKSNIISVTVGQILSKDDHVQADKLLDQIDQLKKKLFQLEKRKELAQLQTIEKAQAAQKDMIITNKSHKKIQTGKIYKRADSNNSRVTEEVQTQGYATQKNNSIAASSAPRQRFSSTQDFSAPNTASKQVQFDNKTGPVIFRVKKNNKTIHGPFGFNLNEKQPLFVKSKDFQTEEKGFQAKRQDYERLEFWQQEKLRVLEKPSQRKLVFDERFKEETDKYFIQLDNEPPKRDWDQEELVQTAKQTFKRFGINIQAQKHLNLSVKKYKNCVSFILDSNRTILWYYEGKFYFGGWKINRLGQGEKSGWGYDYSPGKYVFSGSFVENKRDGYGVIKLLTRQNDTIYEGGWTNGFKHGHGKQREADETQYIGEWVQGKKNGKGKIKGPNGQYFEGTLLGGVKNGEGVQKFKNGDSYEGNYYDGKFHGMGVYIWVNLSKYQGQFKQGSRNGNGIWVSNQYSEETDRYEGLYKNDRKSGFGVYRWKDGTVYQGQFLNDLKHGEGIVSYGDGKSTKLQWFEGNVVSKHIGDKQRINKRSISKSSSKKGEQKGSQTRSPLIKFNMGNESKLKPTRLSFGVEQF